MRVFVRPLLLVILSAAACARSHELSEPVPEVRECATDALAATHADLFSPWGAPTVLATNDREVYALVHSQRALDDEPGTYLASFKVMEDGALVPIGFATQPNFGPWPLAVIPPATPGERPAGLAASAALADWNTDVSMHAARFELSSTALPPAENMGGGEPNHDVGELTYPVVATDGQTIYKLLDLSAVPTVIGNWEFRAMYATRPSLAIGRATSEAPFELGLIRPVPASSSLQVGPEGGGPYAILADRSRVVVPYGGEPIVFVVVASIDGGLGTSSREVGPRWARAESDTEFHSMFDDVEDCSVRYSHFDAAAFTGALISGDASTRPPTRSAREMVFTRWTCGSGARSGSSYLGATETDDGSTATIVFPLEHAPNTRFDFAPQVAVAHGRYALAEVVEDEDRNVHVEGAIYDTTRGELMSAPVARFSLPPMCPTDDTTIVSVSPVAFDVTSSGPDGEAFVVMTHAHCTLMRGALRASEEVEVARVTRLMPDECPRSTWWTASQP